MRTRIPVLIAAFFLTLPVQAAKLVDAKVLDKDYIVLQFRDGEVRYRDTGKGRSAYLGHTFVEGDDTLKTFLPRFNTETSAGKWLIWSRDDKRQNKVTAIYRKSKPMNTDHSLTSELDHWIFLRLERPSRRAADDARWITSENLQRAVMLHYCTKDKALKRQLEAAMYTEAGWCLGRNPGNIVEMTGLGQRHITDCYSTGRNDGLPGTHPGQTPFNGTETWSQGDGGDARSPSSTSATSG